MGYQTYVTGSIKIQPRLPDALISKLGLDPTDEDSESDLEAVQGGEDDTVELINGQITVVPGNSWTVLRCRFEEPYKAYTTQENLDRVAKEVAKQGCTASGALYMDGEESTDLTRVRIENGKAVHEQPSLVWPNGDTGWG